MKVAALALVLALAAAPAGAETVIGSHRDEEGKGYSVLRLDDGRKRLVLEGPQGETARTEPFDGRLISVEELETDAGTHPAALRLAPGSPGAPSGAECETLVRRHVERYRVVTDETDGPVGYDVVRLYDGEGALRELRREPFADSPRSDA